MSEPLKFDFERYTLAIPAIWGDETRNSKESQRIANRVNTESLDSPYIRGGIAKIAGIAASDSEKQKSAVLLEPWQADAITAWVRSLGGSEQTILEEMAQTLEQCRTNPDTLVYYLRRAADVLPRPPKQETAKPVTCHACNNFTPHHAHGKGTGTCYMQVTPSGVVHWHDTQHTCKHIHTQGAATMLDATH